MPFDNDPAHYPSSSRRSLVYAGKGMVATSQPLAAQAGLDVMRKGGNAIDAAVAAAASLTVTEPTSNGIGGDAFALVWTGRQLYGLNASGPAPALISADKIKEAGHTEMPSLGWLPVTVPGAPAAWAELSGRWGNLSLKENLTPAIEYAKEGFPLSPVTAEVWNKVALKYEAVGREARLQGSEKPVELLQEWFRTFSPGGRTPKAGEVACFPDHASTLLSIAESKAESFYKGELAEKIDAFSRKTGGFLRGEDLERYRPLWVDPVSTDYRDCQIWEIPPNGQGLVALMALNTLQDLQVGEKGKEEQYHLQIEAMKLAFADGFKYITDPQKMRVKLEELLSIDRARQRSALIGECAALTGQYPGSGGGTVYLATADDEGNMVSFIQSNYEGFGSGLVVPGTGIALQNRGKEFSLDPGHANYLKPGKRTYHTIIPGFLTRGGKAIGPFGVMGGYMQPQGHVQVVMRLLDDRLNPQAALDAPRWKWVEGNQVEVEYGFPLHLARKLTGRCHEIVYSHDLSGFGRGQIILRNPDSGILCGATEPRADGTVAAW